MPTNGNTSLTWTLEEFNLQRPLNACKYRVGMRTSPDGALTQMKIGLDKKMDSQKNPVFSEFLLSVVSLKRLLGNGFQLTKRLYQVS